MRASALALILCGCTRTVGTTDAPEAGAPPAPSVAVSSEATAAPSAEPAPTGTPEERITSASHWSAVAAGRLPRDLMEARRTSLARLGQDKALAQHEAVIRAHFGGAVPEPLEIQSTPLSGARRAVLLYGPARSRSPLLLVLDAGGGLQWTKERPLAGTRQVVTEMVVAPGPKGEVTLLWCDIPTQLVALRKWAWDGVVLADFEVMEVDLCESLAGLYWQDRGWLAVASQNGAARAQLLDERGRRAFGPRGVELPWKARPSAPAAIVVDTDTSAIIFQVGDLPREGGGAMPDRLLGMRFDTVGTTLWEHPLDLGAAPATASGERIQAALRPQGQVRVSLAKGPAANVTSAGSILAR